jgi:hypothetical protein
MWFRNPGTTAPDAAKIFGVLLGMLAMFLLLWVLFFGFLLARSRAFRVAALA